MTQKHNQLHAWTAEARDWAAKEAARQEAKEAASNTTPKLTLTHKGRDSWDRPVYECDGTLYVDVDPRRHRKPEICTKLGNHFDGEPNNPIAANVAVEFVPCRDVW